MIDTNVVVSAAISPTGPPGRVLAEWRTLSFRWITSPALLDELERTLRYPRLRRYLKWDNEAINEQISFLHRNAIIVEPVRPIEAIIDDPDDDRLLEAAVEGKADCIVSGDRDLLKLVEFEGIPIITPARFIATLSLERE